ncbi:MAG TPA: ArsR family transcriptional regulator [Candidatus Anaerobiospirillum stercoravium]|nr:ArsR family transcriptional regulator [Candidatus Anaerobiospirillum stercoravium]
MTRPRTKVRFTPQDLIKLQTISSNPHETPGRRRRAQIYLLCAQGYSNEEMAQALKLSPTTIGHHLRVLYQHDGNIKQALNTWPKAGRAPKISSAAKHWMRTLYLTQSPPELALSGRRGRNPWTMRSIQRYIHHHCSAAGFPELKTISLASVWLVLRAPSARP